MTCITCKLLEQIITSNLHRFLETGDILSNAQHGFRRERSCDTQLVHTFDALAFNKEKGVITDVLVLDFSKAFDSVSHKKLLFKLRQIGVSTEITSWIEGFLTDRRQFVYVDGFESLSCKVLSGVPQGSVLGPLLFILYINDLPSQITSECRLFADDALVFNTRENNKTLQEDLEILENWSLTWQLSFNPNKCAFLAIDEKITTQQYFLHNTLIQNVKSHPYLGVEISNDLKWDHHIDKIVSKANKVRGMLSRVLNTADTKTRMVAYKTLIRSNLEYACQVWDPFLQKDIKTLEKVQNKSLRFIYRIKSFISFTKLREECGIDSLQDRRKAHRLKLYCKVAQSKVITNRFIEQNQHYTRQENNLYIPSIKSSAYFNSFWPKTTRDIREGI